MNLTMDLRYSSRMRKQGFLPIVFVAAVCVACSTFGEEAKTEDAGPVASDAGDASSADVGVGDAATDAASARDSAVDAGPRNHACFELTCAGGDKCCMATSGHSCKASCNSNAWTFECLGPTDCTGGDICCWNPAAPVGFCTKTCLGYRICRASSDCPAGEQPCTPVTCDTTEVQFKACPKGASGYADYPSAPSCNYL
jgi:hypothetical protein